MELDYVLKTLNAKIKDLEQEIYFKNMRIENLENQLKEKEKKDNE